MYQFLSCHGIKDYPLLAWHFQLRKPDGIDVDELVKRVGFRGESFLVASLKITRMLLVTKTPKYMARNFESSIEYLNEDTGEWNSNEDLISDEKFLDMLNSFKVHGGGCLLRNDSKTLWHGHIYTPCSLETSNRLCVGDHRRSVLREIAATEESSTELSPEAEANMTRLIERAKKHGFSIAVARKGFNGEIVYGGETK